MSTIFPSNENARDCTDKGGACEAGGAWLNYYIKSIRRLGRGLDIAADLGEKSGMIGSCERDACGSAQPKADAVQPLAAHQPHTTVPRLVRQGISSTDKHVTGSHQATGIAGGLSSLSHSGATVATDIASPRAGRTLPWMRAAALVNGRCRLGLDTGAVSAKLPMGKQAARAARGVEFARKFPENSGMHGLLSSLGSIAVAVGRPSSASRRSFSLPQHRTAWMEGVDPAAVRRQTPQGIRRERPAL
ncbi:MAG: hypothetical protein H6Q99_2276 [Proteobacteria bacterium]|nr:hypothetical protein [Pseudomonadota bacterium]